MNNTTANHRTGLIQILIYTLLVIGIYFSTFSWLINKDWARDDYSYGILIPFIVLYLLWEKKNIFFSKLSRQTWYGFVLLLPGIMLFWLGELAGEFFMLYFSCWLIVISLCWINMGMDKLKVIMFPLVFSLTMFPLPNFINVKITLTLKLISSKLGVMMMHAYGMSAFREGNIIDLGFTKLQVVDACSGLRYLFPMIVLSILIAYFYHGWLWKKIILVLSSIPLTIFSNSLRIALTGILSEKFGTKVVDGFFHDFEGLLIFMLTLVVLLLEIWVLNKLFPESWMGEIRKDKKEGEVLQERQDRKFSSLKEPRFIVSIVLLAITFAMSQGIEFREAIPMNRSFDNFPMKIGKWEGRQQTMEQMFIDTLDLSDYIIADYQDDSGKAINFYVAYYESQRKGESIHSPASCLRGGGWQFKQAGKLSLVLNNGTSMPLNRAIIEKEPVKQVSYYWFPSRGRILTNAYQMKIFNFWDALTRQRTDGALVRLITLVYPDESIADAEKRMQDFVFDINPVLIEFLPR